MAWTPPHHFWGSMALRGLDYWFGKRSLTMNSCQWNQSCRLGNPALTITNFVPHGCLQDFQCKAQASARSLCAFRITRKFIFQYPPSNPTILCVLAMIKSLDIGICKLEGRNARTSASVLKFWQGK